MSTNNESDMFDDITLAENSSYQKGYDDGCKVGELDWSSHQDGLRIGHQHGSQLGSELGFYHGFSLMYRRLLEGQDGALPDAHSITRKRVTKALDSLVNMLDVFSFDNPQDDSLQERVQAIRDKFKLVSSLLNLNTEMTSPTKSDFSF